MLWRKLCCVVAGHSPVMEGGGIACERCGRVFDVSKMLRLPATPLRLPADVVSRLLQHGITTEEQLAALPAGLRRAYLGD